MEGSAGRCLSVVTLQYRKGEEHNNAYGLSRIKQTLCSQCETTHSEAKEKKSSAIFEFLKK